MSHENIIGQLDEMQKVHVELLLKLKKIRRKIGLLLSSKKVDKKEEIEEFDGRYKKIIVVIESIITSIEKGIGKVDSSDKKTEFENYKTLFENYKNQLKELEKVEYNKYLANILTTLKYDLENFNINVFGKIKVYMKIKPNSTDKITINSDDSKTKFKTINDFFILNDNETINIKGKKNDEKFGPFSKVLFNYDKTTNANIIKNEDVFNEFSSNSGPLLGTSTILFGYGISGSGKSWTMFGKNKVEEGLISLSIKYLSANGITVEPIEIFEHYLDTGEEFIKIDAAFPTFIENKLKSKIRHFILTDYLVVGSSNIINFDALNKKRENFHSIQRTPNNDKSSRTHLFIIYKISSPGSLDGFITFIDSAGKEEPLEIVKKFYTETEVGKEIQNPSLPFTTDETKLTHASFRRFNFDFFNEGKRFVGKEDDIKREKIKIYTEHLKNVRSVIKEGFFINETLAHIINYFTKDKTIKMKDNKVNNYKSYNKDAKLNVFYNPPKSRKVGIIEKLEESYDNDPILTTTIFDYLTNLCTKKGDTSKKFKFIMLGHTRTEVEYRNDIIKTFKLIDFIKST